MSDNLDKRIERHKTKYKKALENMAHSVALELGRIDGQNFESSGSIDSTAFHLIQELNQLQSLELLRGWGNE